jgi:hypothetical protein
MTLISIIGILMALAMIIVEVAICMLLRLLQSCVAQAGKGRNAEASWPHVRFFFGLSDSKEPPGVPLLKGKVRPRVNRKE